MKIGDKYLVIRTRFSGRRVELGEVTRMTQTRFNIGEDQFMRSTNRILGDSWGSESCWCERYTPKRHDPELEKQAIYDRRQKLYTEMKPQFSKLSLEQLMAIHKIIFADKGEKH